MLKQFLLGIMDAGIVLVLIGFFILISIYRQTPTINDLSQRKINQTSIIYDRTGEHILYTIFGEENRKVVTAKKISDNIRQATIAAEDNNFYSHYGIDPFSILRAFIVNLKANYIKEGASTISQQLVRHIFLSKEKTLTRKLKEAVLAIKLETKYSKDEILNMYLNEIPYGANAYGIQAAAQTYFNKNAINLSVDESAFLAAIPKATTYYFPYGNNQEELLLRQRKILLQMHKLNFINETELSDALSIDTFSKLQKITRPIIAPHFVIYIVNQMEKIYGREMLENGGLRIYTTLDLEMQRTAEDILQTSSDHLAKYEASNAALVAIDPITGEVLAMAGSLNYFNDAIDGQVNVTTRQRQPGSSFKPIVYAKSFQKGLEPETLIYDVQTNFGPDGSGKNYIPRNYDGKFHGLVSLRQALAMSLNIPAVKVLYLAGVNDTLDLANQLGFTTLTDRKNYGLALALGGGSITLLEETFAFSVFANDGIKNDQRFILKINDAQNKKLLETKLNSKRVLSPEIARKINSILSDNIARSATFGTNNPLFIPGKVIAAKTGTTQDYRDAWTLGYTPALAVGVWAGNNNNSPMRLGAAGAYVAAPIWNKFMKSKVASDYLDAPFIPYTKNTGNTPMLYGKAETKTIYYNKKTGKRLSTKKKNKLSPNKIRTENKTKTHTLFYYLTHKAPTDVSVNFPKNNTMLSRWETLSKK